MAYVIDNANDIDPLDALRKDVCKFQELDGRAGSLHTEELFHRVVGSIHLLCARIAECEQANVTREAIARVLAPARAIHGRSPFIQRLQTWPRGYPGDFETIDYLCFGRVGAPPGRVEHVCELYSLTCAAAQQHRNKVRHQAELIVRVVTSRPGARILILGGGSCQDVVHALPALLGKEFELVLNDNDPEALALAEQKLGAIHKHISLRSGSVLRLLRHATALGRFDLVLAGGLFDYLSEEHIIFILTQVYHHLLCDGGRLFFTNMALNNPYRLWMTYLADWHLIERSHEEICRIVADAHIATANLVIDKDETALTFLVQVSKPKSL